LPLSTSCSSLCSITLLPHPHTSTLSLHDALPISRHCPSIWQTKRISDSQHPHTSSCSKSDSDSVHSSSASSCRHSATADCTSSSYCQSWQRWWYSTSCTGDMRAGVEVQKRWKRI